MMNTASSGSLSGGHVAPFHHAGSTDSLQGLAAMGEPPPCRTIYVRNISPDTDDGQLQAMFEVGLVHFWVAVGGAVSRVLWIGETVPAQFPSVPRLSCLAAAAELLCEEAERKDARAFRSLACSLARQVYETGVLSSGQRLHGCWAQQLLLDMPA